MTAKTETDKERRKREREDLFALLLAFLLLQRQKLGAIAMSIALDGAPAASALATAYAVLLRTHAQSIAYGRTLAVQAAPASTEEPTEEPEQQPAEEPPVTEPAITDDDTAEAVAVMAEQAEYLTEFFRAIEEGRYTEPATEDNPAGVDIEGMMRRMGLYVRRAIGSANRAWVDGLPRDAEIYWRLGETEMHCSDCPELARNSPYTKATLPTVPGSGATQCFVNCLCHLETADGDEGIPVRMEGL